MRQPKDGVSLICETFQRRVLLRVIGLLLLLSGLSASAQTQDKQTQIAALNREMDSAIQQVRRIVNQPVSRLFYNSGMRVATYSPGWFHEGANKPDFNNVDVRTTQEKIYDSNEYVTSDVTPGVVFRGRDLEFNANTKYFYTDRSLPKKKLTEPEMLEINRLYRIIGRCEQQLIALQNPMQSPPQDSSNSSDSALHPDSFSKFVSAHPLSIILLLLVAVYVIRR